MYTKVFRTIYDGTLADNWQALVTFQQLLILANDDGVVDMTVAAIHRTTGIPMDILTSGIAALEAPDEGSRTPDMEGRRIVRLDEHRTWGWFLVNFAKYRQMISREEKKEADRNRISAKRDAEKSPEINDVADSREESQGVAEDRKVSQDVADVAYTDLDTEVKAKARRSAGAELSPQFREFWEAYPRTDGKKAAVRIWARQRFDRIAARIVADVKRRVSDGSWCDQRFVPFASTYLNQERWNDGAKPQAGTAADSDLPDFMQGMV